MKPCPYCSEQIQDTAIKCRFCGSMLDGSHPAPGSQAAAPGQAGQRALPAALTIYEGTPSWKAWFWGYVSAYATVVGILLWLPVVHLRRKGVRYHITSRSIEYETGVFAKKIDTLPLWRVLDIEYQQSLWDRLLGIATIKVVTKDAQIPFLLLRGLPASREVFERLRDATEVARQQRVVEVV